MPRLTAVDLFSGAGGATQGLLDAGFDVIGAVENDPAASQSYRLNHPTARLWDADIRTIAATSMLRELGLRPGELGLLKACPPCQGFSSLSEGRATINSAQNDLVLHTIRFVRALKPKAVLLENVPGLGRDARSLRLQTALNALGYATRQYTVNAVDFGVPQRRRRLIIVALRGRRRSLPTAISPLGLDGPVPPEATVAGAFAQLATELHADDPLSVQRVVHPKVLERIKAVPVGGSRFDLPPELRLACHDRADAKGKSAATSSYGRLVASRPAPTMTTRCTTPACGSFIHPTEDRGITLREAATLQTFPSDYQFIGSYGEIERQIGNAVPVKMATALGRRIASLVESASP
jgi:DNA (cytosine-5)-methyltransferase 1